MLDYLDLLARNRQAPEHAASPHRPVREELNRITWKKLQDGLFGFIGDASRGTPHRIYVIKKHGKTWEIRARGTVGPILGEGYGSVDEAKRAADRIDREKYPELRGAAEQVLYAEPLTRRGRGCFTQGGVSRRSGRSSSRSDRKAQSAAREGAPMAKGKKAKKGGGGGSRKKARTPAQKAASLRNLAKARSARKRATKRHTVKPYSYARTAKTVHVPEHKSWEGRGKRRGGQTAKQRAASLRNLKKARAAQRRGHRGARETRRSPRRSPSRRSSGREAAYEESPKKKKRKKAKKNPQGPMEMFFGGITLLLGFGTADFTDRMWATHALTDKNAKDAAGHELFADPGGATGTSYQGLLNPTAICAPMNAVRWLSGGLITIVPIGLGGIVKNDVGRSALQMFGYGAGARILGKALIDLMAVLTRNTATGQRLYDGEMRAMALKAGDGSEASLPSAGLGKALGCAGGCGGKCASCAQVAADVRARNAAGTGWPSAPRETAAKTGTSTTQTPPQIAPPPPPPPPLVPQALTGTPARTRPNHYRWGEDRYAA